MKAQFSKYGIEGHQAPEFQSFDWVDGSGNKMVPLELKQLKGMFKVIYCFQSWCPGCHSRGFPALQKMVEALKGNEKLAFMAIQTVFEGAEANTYEKMLETQIQYDLQIPFGHDVGDESTNNSSSVMYGYRSGGTPWFILIDQNDKVVFNDFHLNAENAIEFLLKIN